MTPSEPMAISSVPRSSPTPPPSSDPLAGTAYRALGPIGQGGMATVYEAVHSALGTPVVVKVLSAEHAAAPALVERMRLEAQVLARLCHPNLVEVRDLGLTPDGRPFIVLERLLGCTLHDLLRNEAPLPPARAAAILRSVLAGLEAAHRAGVVHRDVKPSNLFLTRDGTVKVLDFGVAKLVTDASVGVAPLAHPTELGSVVGTPRYLAPEQALGGPVDHRTDIYGAAGVLYALLVGHDPFAHRRTAYEVLRAHLGEAPRPPSVALGRPLPPGLDAVVLRGLEKRADARFPSAAAFAEALLPFVAATPPPPAATARAAPAPTPAPPPARSEEASDAPPSLARLALWTALSTVVALAVAQAWMAVFGPLF